MKTAAAGYYRHPTIHGDTIVFVCEDDLWSVPAEGGVARRLTAGAGRAAFPRFSPDGARIAFTGQDDGPTEIYVMDARGSTPERITHLGTYTINAGWRPDGKAVLFQSNWRRPFMGDIHLHQAPAEGGPAEVLPYGPARAVDFEPGGAGVVLGINSGDPARWKRYRGGTAGTIWIDRAGKGEFRPLIGLQGNLAGPMWIGNRIWFLSDHEGHGNLYSCTPTGRGLRRHTHHDDFYVRYPSTDGQRIVYHAGADVYLFDPERGETRKVAIEMASPRAQRARRFVEAVDYLETAALHPDGHSLACVARGGAFTFPLWEGAPRRHDPGSGVRYRLARWLGDGKRLVAVSDERGEEELVLFSPTGAGRPRRIRGDFGRILDLVPGPAAVKRVALSNHRQEVWVVDLATGKAKKAERSKYDRIHGMAWSPDGRWLAYGFSVTRTASSIHLWDGRTGKVHEITRPDFQDFRPAFDPGGKYLYFLSSRVFDPVSDNQVFDLGFPRGDRPYLIPLAAETPSPFDSATRPARAPQAPAHDGKAKKKGAAETKVDLEGITDRVVAFPVSEGRYQRIEGAPGRVFFSSTGVEGILEADWLEAGPPAAKATLQCHDLEQGKTDSFKEPISDFSLSEGGKTLLLRVGNRLRVLAADADVKEVPAKTEPGRESGWIDLGRPRIAVAPGAEWRQMFREAWRLMRDQFWSKDMSRIDWRGVHDRYLPLVDRVASRIEFSDLIWEMQGELGTSHCYEMLGDYRPSPQWFQGHLGADVDYDRRTKKWRVRRIVRGDSWERKAASPLGAPGLGLKVGDEIVAVDGLEVGPDRSPFECLVNQAARDVHLRVRSRGGRPRDVVVHTLTDEVPLRYREWVERNRERVHKESKGRVGYIHIPDMGPWGFAEFHRYFRNEMDRDGLIVDVRWNGGGYVSALLLEKLARRRTGYDVSRWQGAFPYPMEAPVGPMVALTNEYAGSDGDIFSHNFKLYGLGPLIGKRTWGGVVGIWPRHALVDGSMTSQPEFGFWFRDVEWGVENYGTDPDIEVEIRPQDHAAGRDPQMERGLREIRKILRTVKPKVPPFDDRPDLSAPKLPTGPSGPD